MATASRLTRLRLWRPGLVTSFGLASVFPVAVIGLVLAHFMQAQVHERALAEATRAATLIARVGIQPQISEYAMTEGFSAGRIAELDEALSIGGSDANIVRVKIWNRDQIIVYSDDETLIGRSFPPSHDLEEAFEGAVESELTTLGDEENFSERELGKALEVYVPFAFRGSTEPDGVFELYFSYAPIAAAIEEDTRTLYALLVAGLVVLYAALYRIALGASRKLRRQAETNAHQALHDGLTNLPNRTLFRDRLAQAIEVARREGHEVAVMLMDLDRFKEVNDTLGHDSGDRLLEELAARLRGVLRASDTIARLGGDEFGLLLPHVREETDPADAAARVVDALEAPFLLQGVPIAVEASIGIALYPEHGADVDTLIQRADVAMYAAKSAHGGYAFYDASTDDYSPTRLRLVAELRRAIDGGELTLHYQPKAQLPNGDVVGVEALVRWLHPTRGLLPPSEFLPLAQHTNLIKPLTLYVLDTALRQCNEWHAAGLGIGSVAVNLSTRSLLDLELPDDVARLLAKWDVEPASLELEITETMIMADPRRAATIVSRLAELGVRIAIDDFGTGYSSLEHLSGLPVDEIKIDRSFVTGMAESARDAVIVRSTIDLGRNLGLDVVAEGVETEQVWDALGELGCDAAQGFYYSRPVPADELVAWLRGRAAATS